MNQAAASFKALISAFSQDASSHAVEVHAANLAAEVAANGETRVAFVKRETIPSLFNLIYFLDTYSVILSSKYTESGEHAYIIASIATRPGYEYKAVATERRLEAVAA